MIVVDTSVWVDYFRGTETPESSFLDALLGREMVAVGDLILAEVLQGFRSDKDYRLAKSHLIRMPVYEMLGTRRAVACADNFRALRKKGITIRKTIDVIIASFCIEKGCALLYSDRDFDPFVEHLGLVSAG
ncbi:MAG: putative nucleic acid-binding protein [Rhodothermales bacterium]|jgi:predicted nucleic acid-binding protein